MVLGAHHGSLGIARSLGRLGVAVHVVHDGAETPALRSRYWRGRHRWEFGAAPAADALGFLLELARTVGAPAVLIPTSDILAEFVADHSEALRERFVFQQNPPELVRSLCNKREVDLLARQHGIPAPRTVFPASCAEVVRFAAHGTFPVVLKPSDSGWLAARTGKPMVIVGSGAELLAEYRALEDPEHPQLLLQEYIPGGDDTICMFNGYFDRTGRCRAGFTGRKLRQHPVHIGGTSLGVCEENPTVRALAIRFMQVIGYRGIVDIGFRYDGRDGLYKLLDPNPRIGSTFRLFVDIDGLDVARCLYLDLSGQAVPAPSSYAGRKWVVEDTDLLSCLAYRREGALTVGQWMASYRGVQEGAWFARDDWRPFVAMIAGFGRRIVRKVVRRAA